MVPVLKWRLFPGNGEDHKLSQNKLLRALEAMCQANQDHLAQTRGTPLLYESGVIYQQEPPGFEEWCDIPTILKAGWGDCEDLAGWLVAELRHTWKIPARPFLRFRKRSGAYHYHALLVIPQSWVTVWELACDPHTTRPLVDNKGLPFIRPRRKPVYEGPKGFVFEDPSARLGMYHGKMDYKNAYRDIKAKIFDPLAEKIAAAPILSIREARALGPAESALIKRAA